MMNKINEISNKHGQLTVTAGSKTVDSRVMWLCMCDCGNELVVRGNDLRSGHTKSCGCSSNIIDEIGNRYGLLIVIAKSGAVGGRAMWLCKCDCGNEKIVSGHNLRLNTKSCGCLRDIASSKRSGSNHPRYTDGASCGMGTKEQKEFHESIRKRDNYTCQDCGKTQEQELKDTNIRRRLSVHHKDGDHFHNTDENAITLCESCHQKLESEISSITQDAKIQWAVHEMETNDEQ